MFLIISGFVFFVALIICSLIFFLQHRNKKNLMNKRLATILTPSGDRKDKLLSVNFNELHDIDPDTNEDIVYFIRPDKAWKTDWPFGRPKLLQVSINSFIYKERDPEPLDPYMRPAVIDGLVLGNLKSISFSRAMVGRSEEIVQEQELRKVPKKKKFPVFLFVILGVLLIGVILAVVFIFGGQGTPPPL